MRLENKIAGGNHRRPGAFTLVELLVVIGIIAMLIALLLPSARKAMQSAKKVNCQSNLRQISIMLVTYANNNRGYLYPMGSDDSTGFPITLGTNVAPWYCWPVYVFPDLTRKPLPSPLPAKPALGWEALPYDIQQQWSTKILYCPTDDEQPAAAHSYILNKHLADNRIRYNTSLLRVAGKAASDVVLMGEKITTAADYYLAVTRDPVTGEPITTEFYKIVELYRHGPSYGSNYLYVDMHVDSMAPKESLNAFDPWDVPR